jgi:phenolic acid decarboxylase
MVQRWVEKQEEDPETHAIIQQGLDKLNTYREQANLVPAYVVAMIKFS